MHLLTAIYISLGWLGFTTLILIRNLFEFKRIRNITHKSDESPLVSICIPARNEEANIARCVESILQQNYDNIEVLVLDDHSEDDTAQILNKLSENDNRLHVFQGEDKPSEWLGKPWACHQLGGKAKGDIFMFIDADTWWDKNTLSKIVSAFEKKNLNAITVWPHQHTGSFIENTVLPLVYYALSGFLVSIYTYRPPRWIPPFINKKVAPLFAAANGQCIGFRKEAYHQISGHESVKSEVVEDVQLAKNLISNGLNIRMYNGYEAVHCRMYTSPDQVWQGFRKNFLAGFGYNLPLFFFSWILHILMYLFPVFTLAYGIIHDIPILTSLSILALSLAIIHRLIIAFQFGYKPLFSFTHIFGVLWFQLLAAQCVYDLIFQKKVSWKGRPV